jgi:predicted Zn-dependent protease
VEPEAALEAQIGLARLDAEEGKLDGALSTLADVLARHPDNLYALLSHANLSIRRDRPGDAEAAIVDTARALQIDQKNPSALYTRGCAFIAAKAVDASWAAKAEEAFHLLDERQPGSPLSAYGRARLDAAQMNKPGVLAHLKEARERSQKVGTLAGGWNATEVKGDPAFRAFREDADFTQVVGS